MLTLFGARNDLEGASLDPAALIAGANIDEWWRASGASPDLNRTAHRLA
jgi:hypothetical protein